MAAPSGGPWAVWIPTVPIWGFFTHLSFLAEGKEKLGRSPTSLSPRVSAVFPAPPEAPSLFSKNRLQGHEPEATAVGTSERSLGWCPRSLSCCQGLQTMPGSLPTWCLTLPFPFGPCYRDSPPLLWPHDVHRLLDGLWPSFPWSALLAPLPAASAHILATSCGSVHCSGSREGAALLKVVIGFNFVIPLHRVSL